MGPCPKLDQLGLLFPHLTLATDRDRDQELLSRVIPTPELRSSMNSCCRNLWAALAFPFPRCHFSFEFCDRSQFPSNRCLFSWSWVLITHIQNKLLKYLKLNTWHTLKSAPSSVSCLKSCTATHECFSWTSWDLPETVSFFIILSRLFRSRLSIFCFPTYLFSKSRV